MTVFEVLEADITTLDVDAIVNAANAQLRPGGGVDGAIHRAAGPELARACAAIGGCPTGEVRSTPGFRLKARHVIHAVGPVWHGGGQDEAGLLAACYANAIDELSRLGGRTIAFPAISTGIYGFPPEQAAPIAVQTARHAAARAGGIERVVFACFSQGAADLHRRALNLPV